MAFDSFEPRSMLPGRIRRTFELASLRHQAARHLQGEDRVACAKVVEAYAQQRSEMINAYAGEYQTRVETEVKRLINKAGEKHRDLQPRWSDSDRFDRHAITRQAQRNVRQDHDQSLSRLDAQETQIVSGILERAENRQAGRQAERKTEAERLSGRFEKSAERRQGRERGPAHRRPRQR